MRKYLLSAFMLLSVVAVSSCKKDKDMKKATVPDSGDIAKGGCGFLLLLEDGKLVRPSYLPSAYQHDGYRVKVKYAADGEGEVCETYPTKKFIEVIEIKDIKRDLD